MQHYSPQDPKAQVDACIASERIRYSEHFNTLLAQERLSYSGLSVLRLLKRLKLSRRAIEFDYRKGGKIPCFVFVASKTPDNPALSIVVSFEKTGDGSVHLWIQEFHR